MSTDVIGLSATEQRANQHAHEPLRQRERVGIVRSAAVRGPHSSIRAPTAITASSRSDVETEEFGHADVGSIARCSDTKIANVYVSKHMRALKKASEVRLMKTLVNLAYM